LAQYFTPQGRDNRPVLKRLQVRLTNENIQTQQHLCLIKSYA